MASNTFRRSTTRRTRRPKDQANGASASATRLRRQATKRLQSLSADRLAVADDFLAYLQSRQTNEATAELLAIPGFMEELRSAERSVATGKRIRLEDLRRKFP